GQIVVQGSNSLPFLQRLVTNDVTKLKPNKVKYSLMCNENGGTVDDFLIYMLDVDHYLLVVNASNIGKVYEWLQYHKENYKRKTLSIVNRSKDYSILALQGPKAEAILSNI